MLAPGGMGEQILERGLRRGLRQALRRGLRTLPACAMMAGLLCAPSLAQDPHQAPPPGAGSSAASPAPASGAATADAIDQAVNALRQGRPQQALDALEAAIAADPNNPAANLLAASAAIALYRPDLAVTYGERAQTLEPDNWKVHTTLVTAYAMAGKSQQRDTERATLRAVHAAAKEPDARQASGFLLDLFKVGRYRVEAVEYFAPVGRFHIYYRFIVRNASNVRVWQIEVQSDDFNQASWAKAYPEQAAQGQRQFQLTGESYAAPPGSSTHRDYRAFSGLADYDQVKARVIEILNAQAEPLPGEAQAKPE